MRDWTMLADQVNTFLQQTAIYPNEITTALRHELSQFDLLVIEKLESFLRLPIADAEKEKRLRCFFAMRWTAIVNTSLDYTFNPNSPANQACLLIATHIRKADEATCLILMPTIEKVLGSSFPDDVKLASEDLEDQLILSNFITSENGCALIALEDLLSHARINPDLFFSIPDADSEDDACSVVVPYLTAEDRQRVRDVCGEIGEPYFEALEKKHRILNGEHLTVGHALQTLIRQLLRGSVIAEGTDAHAQFAECYHPILTFYRIWFDLSESSRKKIAAYRPEHSNDPKHSLESQLLCLFYAASLCLTEADRKRVIEENNIDCAHQIALTLEGILRFHLKELTGIPLPGKEKECECEVAPDGNELSLKEQWCIAALPNRGAFLGARDEVIAVNALFFDTLTEHAFDPKFADETLQALCNQISSIQDFISGLLLLPPEQWKKMIKTIGACMDSILAPDQKSWDALSFILKQLPAQHWKIFCDALCELYRIQRIIKARDLAMLMQEFPEKHLAFLPAALEVLSAYVLVTSEDVASLFPDAILPQWPQQYLIFQSSIKAIIHNPAALANVFPFIQRQDWTHLVYVFQEIIAEKLSQKKFFTTALPVLSDLNKVFFIEAVVSIFGDTDIINAHSQAHLMDMMQGVGIGHWERLFPTLGSEQLTKWIPNEDVLSTLLGELDAPAHRIVFVSSFRNAPLSFQINPQAFYQLIGRFPECREVLLTVFREQLPRVLQNFAVTLSTMRSYSHKVPEPFYYHFQFYMETALPILFSKEVLERLVPRLGRVPRVLSVEEIEKKTEDKTLTPLAAAFEKMELFHHFIKKHPLHLNPEYEVQLLVRSFMSVFGVEFFEDLLKYKNENLVSLREHCCVSRVTSSHTQAINQRFFSPNPRTPASVRTGRLQPPPASLQDLLRNMRLRNTPTGNARHLQ